MLSYGDEPVKRPRVSLLLGIVSPNFTVKDQDRLTNDLATDFDEEAVMESFPNLLYERAVNRFVGNEAIDVTRLTQICFKLDPSSYFFSDKRHDLPDEIDKGYIAFHDYKCSRYDVLLFNIKYQAVFHLTLLYSTLKS